MGTPPPPDGPERNACPALQEDSYLGLGDVGGALPTWLRGSLYRAGPGLWEAGNRQLRHLSDGFAVIGNVKFEGGGGVIAHQRFVDNEPYRAARFRGELIVNKFASRRRFEGWGAWAQDRIRVSNPAFCLSLDAPSMTPSPFEVLTPAVFSHAYL